MIKISYLKFLVLLFSFSLNINANEIDNKTFVIYQNQIKKYLNTDVNKSIDYGKKILKNSTHPIHTAYAHSVLAVLYRDVNQNKLSDYHFEQSSKALQTKDDSSFAMANQAQSFNFIGIYYNYKADFTNALKYYFKAKTLALKVEDMMLVNKLNQNIAIIKSEIGFYEEALRLYRESELNLNKFKKLYNEKDFQYYKSLLNYNMAMDYEHLFVKKNRNIHYLDSSEISFKKALLVSDEHLEIKMNALNNLGNIYYFRKNLIDAKKHYLLVHSLAKNNPQMVSHLYYSNYNLGLVAFEEKDFEKSIFYFEKVLKLFQANETLKINEFIDANLKLSKIYGELNQMEQSNRYLDVYKKLLEKHQLKENQNQLDVNYLFGVKEEQTELNKTKNESNIRNFWIITLVLLLFLFIIIYLKLAVSPKKTEEKKDSETNENSILDNSFDDQQELQNTTKEQKVISLNISIEQEKEILKGLKSLIDSKKYLSKEFNQQYVSKRIKTNTSYLSYVVNKHHGKSFSNYYNELRINYVIEQIYSNTRFREYTTQAIAESAGFKNADSFTTSFKKKTGKTPFQFIKEVKEQN